MQKEFAKTYDPKEAEPSIQKFWEEKKLFKFNPNSKKPVFSIDTPPPYISGYLHVGHAMHYTQFEFVARFWRMMGYEVFFPFGFDDNGLPTERFVEKKNNINSNKMPRKEFINLCLKETKEAGKLYKKIFTRLGHSMDWSLLYSTINPHCTKTAQLSFIDLYEKGRIVREEEPVIWCPFCQSAMSQADLEDKEEEAYLNHIYFELENGEKIVIATTRPEFLPACVGIFVHPDDKRYKKLIGKKAKVPIFGQNVEIMSDEKVDPEFGSGIVMICTFGDKTDIEWWRDYKLDTKIIIDKQGRLTTKNYSNLTINQARERILEDLKKEGLLIKQEKMSHALNVHERCGTAVEFLITPQWIIKQLDLKEKMIEQGRKIKWYPEFMKKRYEHWVEGLKWDWVISRQRHYGVPFPVWYCKKCDEPIIADKNQIPVYPTQDKPKNPCKCGSKEFMPEEDIMDTWMTSSLTPLITAKWAEKIMNKVYPMSLRPQAHDIIRTWAYYTILKSYLHTNSLPWKHIMISGYGQDEHGKKMSKSKGNVIEPLPLVDKYSADALRFWAACVKLGEDLPFKEKDLITGQRLLTKLWNASKFVGTHLKDYKPEKIELETIDKWILSKLMKLVKDSTENFEKYEYNQTKLETEVFFWHDFCDNYLEMVKHRLYGKDEKLKKSAQYTLYRTLLTILKLFAPIIPHITEEIYQILFKEREKDISIHISKWPEFDRDFIDEKAEEIGELGKDIISALRQYKSSRKMALNTELRKVIIDCDKETQEKIKEIEEDIKGTMKIKEIGFGKAKEAVIDKFKMDVKI